MTGATPFWRAAHAVDVPAMKLLVKYGADPNIATTRGGGGGRGWSAVAERLGAPRSGSVGPAARGARRSERLPDPRGRGRRVRQRLHRQLPPAAPNGWLPAVKYLVEELHADVNIRDAAGYTPLHHAASRGDNEMVKYLVSKGADVTVVVSAPARPRPTWRTVPASASLPFPETIALLESMGAKNNHHCVSC
jgi:ankyrin repeat protein